MMDAQRDGRLVLLYSGYVIPPGARDHEFSAGWNRHLGFDLLAGATQGLQH